MTSFEKIHMQYYEHEAISDFVGWHEDGIYYVYQLSTKYLEKIIKFDTPWPTHLVGYFPKIEFDEVV